MPKTQVDFKKPGYYVAFWQSMDIFENMGGRWTFCRLDFHQVLGVIILNVPGDFMCVNVMFDTSCEVTDVVKTTYRPCGQCSGGQSLDKSRWSKL